MTPNLVVGRATIRGEDAISAESKDLFDKLRGDVLIVDCLDPASWLPRLIRLRGKGQIRRAIVLVAAEPWADWFTVVQESGMSCCFLRMSGGHGDRLALLHLGLGDAAFRVAMTSVGTVWRS